MALRSLLPPRTNARADDGEADAHERWFLERVVVVDPEGESFTFPCGEWLGHDAPAQSLSAFFGLGRRAWLGLL